jgi:hypothetical protein
MIVYPHLEYDSLQTRCNKDIIQFVKGIKNTKTDYEEVQYTLVNPTENSTVGELRNNLEPLMTIFRDNLSGKDYVKEISHIDDKKIQNKLWVCRTYLFYQLLIYVSAVCTYKKLYDVICIPYYDEAGYMATNRNMFEFRIDVTGILYVTNLGIFGSLSPTSDIDLGYDLNYDKCKLNGPSLAYLVACTESMFFIFTDKSSLSWDIEVYANMLTLPNPNQHINNNPDYFYLDTSQFTIADCNTVLQPVIAGMLRNIILGYKDHHKPLHTIKNTLNNSSRTLLALLTDNKMAYDPTNTIDLVKVIRRIDPQLLSIFNNKDMFTSAQNDALQYIRLAETNEKQALLLYYKKFNEAEQIQINILNRIKNDLSLLTKDDIVAMLVAWEKASLYKMENYISSPSIIHIVRLLQAQKDNLDKYKTTTPAQYCANKIKPLEPYCIIGKYGYVISILEQIGYMIRFYNTYCITSTANNSHYDKAKCDKKIIKYKNRVDDGINRLESIYTNNEKIVHSITRYMGVSSPSPRMPPRVPPRVPSRMPLITVQSGGHKTKLYKKHHSRKKTKKTRKHRKHRN